MGGNETRSAAAANQIRLKLAAAGVPLDGLRWKITGYPPYLPGFEFQCADYEKLLTRAENSPHWGHNDVTLPGNDPWRDAGIDSFGYSQKGVYAYLHLDISTSRPGLCRVYVAPRSWGVWRNALDGPPRFRDNEVYRAIADRLAALGIKLDRFIDSAPDIGGTTLDGITFTPVDYSGLAKAVEGAKRASGQTFIEGKKTASQDAIDLSFLATSGRGFREISWINGAQASLDFSALHIALSPLRCNIHIDEFGVVIAGPDGQTSLSPNALHHIANELVLRTIVKEFLRDHLGLPSVYIDHLFVELPNSANLFSQLGFGLELHPWRSVTLTAGYSCSREDGCRKTFTLTKSF